MGDAIDMQGRRERVAKARRAPHRQARCTMLLPDDLTGLRVLDIGCRNGLGARKIASRVGPTGLCVGTDPDPARIELARARRDAEGPANLSFARAGWGSLAEAPATTGLGGARFDVVVVNSVLNLAPDLVAALCEIERLLAAGGYLYHDAVFEVAPPARLPAETIAACRTAENVFGCAPTWDTFSDALGQAGFTRWEARDRASLAIPEGDVRPDLVGRTYESALVQAWA